MSPWETAFCAFGALVGLLFTGVPVGFAMMIVGAGGLAPVSYTHLTLPTNREV